MKYIVLEEISLEALIASVNKLTAEGWSVQGGVSHSKVPQNHQMWQITYCQALIK